MSMPRSSVEIPFQVSVLYFPILFYCVLIPCLHPLRVLNLWIFCIINISKNTAISSTLLPDDFRPDCLSTTNGATYVGMLNKTMSSRSCQMWSEQTPNLHPYDDISFFADSLMSHNVSIASVRNDCRNPSFDSTYDVAPWCYVVENSTVLLSPREYCIIPGCKGITFFQLSGVHKLMLIFLQRLFKWGW